MLKKAKPKLKRKAKKASAEAPTSLQGPRFSVFLVSSMGMERNSLRVYRTLRLAVQIVKVRPLVGSGAQAKPGPAKEQTEAGGLA